MKNISDEAASLIAATQALLTEAQKENFLQVIVLGETLAGETRVLGTNMPVGQLTLFEKILQLHTSKTLNNFSKD